MSPFAVLQSLAHGAAAFRHFVEMFLPLTKLGRHHLYPEETGTCRGGIRRVDRTPFADAAERTAAPERIGAAAAEVRALSNARNSIREGDRLRHAPSW